MPSVRLQAAMPRMEVTRMIFRPSCDTTASATKQLTSSVPPTRILARCGSRHAPRHGHTCTNQR